jgi:tRNA(His) 5'-end guanylyltransferase
MENSLGNRIKQYENVSSHRLVHRLPVIIRVDGKAFHTFTKNSEKPFDRRLIDAMVESAYQVSREMMGFVLAYHQSDEVTFYINNVRNLDSEAWFDNKLSKIISVTASLFTARFNDIYGSTNAIFDCRAFNVPYTEVPNVFIWRQRDWQRNSLHMYARSIFSHKDLMNKRGTQIREMLERESFSWDSLHRQLRNGTFITPKGHQLWGEYTYNDIRLLLNEIEQGNR